MFGRRHPGLRPGSVPRDTGAGLPPPTARACAELLEVLERFAGLQTRLDGEPDPGPEGQKAAAEALWAARADCDRLADALVRSQPRTSAEAAAKRDALVLYLARAGVDQLLWRSYFETDFHVARSSTSAPAGDSVGGLPWKAWLKRGPPSPAR